MRQIEGNTAIKTNICIVGGGAAGITLANELTKASLDVCLVESGGFEFAQNVQDLYRGYYQGLTKDYLTSSRLRYYGGTTNVWLGFCRPLDPVDFIKRDWLRYSGWPITKKELDTYYDKAARICELKTFNYREENIFKNSPLLFKLFEQSPPTFFSQKYKLSLSNTKTTRVYLHANVLNIELNETGSSVERLKIQTFKKNTVWLHANVFILAMGGIENARLLLLSSDRMPQGIGNQNDLVGRFFMDHPRINTGILFQTGWNEMDDNKYDDPQRLTKFLSFTDDFLLSKRMLNFGCIPVLDNIGEDSLNHHLMSNIQKLDEYRKHLKNLYAAKKKRTGSKSGLFFYRFLNFLEQAPNPDSRITLTDERDNFNQNMVRLDWRLSRIDKDTLKQAQNTLAKEFGHLGLGRVRVELPNDIDQMKIFHFKEGKHHMGTTRMQGDPKMGVVDSNGKVHGVRNLFVAGSSVFPTSGFANPTLTIVALAVRLSDYIESKYS